MNWSLIITLVISALVVATIVSVVVVTVVGRQKSALGPSGPSGPSGPTKKCPVLPLSSLVSCDPKKERECKNCLGATLGYQCYVVNQQNPYKYLDGTTTYDIPEGNWCLPTKVATSKCNLWTGIPILTKISEGNYEWACDCSVYPQWFTSAPGGDCTFETVCGYNEVSKKSIGELVCPTGGIPGICKAGESWLDNPNWDPALGICSCKTGYISVNRTDPGTGQLIKDCTLNPCYPLGNLWTGSTPPSGHETCFEGNPPQTKGCSCLAKKETNGIWKSYVRCPEDVISTDKKPCVDSPRCYNDPCNPYGYWDSSVSPCTCKCTSPGSVAKPANNIVGTACVKPCEYDNPCVEVDGTKRGTCYINSKGEAKCENCIPPWIEDPSGQCRSKCNSEGSSCTLINPGCCKGLSCQDIDGLGNGSCKPE